MKSASQEKILVIKLGALGDFIQALGPMKAIRAKHPDAHITLMTTPLFKNFGEKSKYFDEIWHDHTRPKKTNILKWISLRKKLITEQYDRVYDLQNNDRTNLYFKLFPKSKRPEWVGAAKGASHENSSPQRIAGHAFDGHKQTLGLADINKIEIDSLDWITEDLTQFNLNKPYILLVPGCAPQHPHKRWPAKFFAEIATQLTKQKHQVVLLGTNAEKEATDKIMESCPNCINLSGRTSLFQIAALARTAAAAIGNDTGPMHIIGPTQCPSLVLFSGRSNPKRHAPLGENIQVIQKEKIEDITTEDVIKRLKKYI